MSQPCSEFPLVATYEQLVERDRDHDCDGVGLVNKIRAYELQDRGLDTVDANVALGFRDDERDYEVAAHMLASLNVKSIGLMTNNPRKISELEKLGTRVSARLPHVIPANE